MTVQQTERNATKKIKLYKKCENKACEKFADGSLVS